MKKLIFATILFFSTLHVGIAQQESMSEIFKEMEQMQREMLQQLGKMEFNGQGFQLFIDTTFTHSFGDMDMGFNEHFMEQLDPALFDDMFKQLQQQLSQMDENDWAEIEQLFRGFEGISPIYPRIPREEDTTEPKDQQPVQKKKKKRKIYKM